MTIVLVDIHKEKLIQKHEIPQDPYTVAFLYCCERFQRDLVSSRVSVGKVILESRGPGLDKLYRSRLDNFLNMGTKFIKLKNIAKPVFHVSGPESPLPIADFACYALHKYLNKKEEALFQKLKGKLRQGHSGKTDGYGFVIYPK